MTFEDNLARLERIARELERDDLSLEVALRLFEEGLAKLRAATDELRAAEGRVQTLVEESAGVFGVTDARE